MHFVHHKPLQPSSVANTKTCESGCTTAIGGPSACAMDGYMKKLNSVEAKACYLEKLSLLGLRKSDDPYIEHSSSVFVDHMLSEVLATYAMMTPWYPVYRVDSSYPLTDLDL